MVNFLLRTAAPRPVSGPGISACSSLGVQVTPLSQRLTEKYNAKLLNIPSVTQNKLKYSL